MTGDAWETTHLCWGWLLGLPHYNIYDVCFQMIMDGMVDIAKQYDIISDIKYHMNSIPIVDNRWD